MALYIKVLPGIVYAYSICVAYLLQSIYKLARFFFFCAHAAIAGMGIAIIMHTEQAYRERDCA